MLRIEPVHIRKASEADAEAIGAFMDEIERSKRLIRKTFRFESDRQRALAVGKFEEGRAAYAKLLG